MTSADWAAWATAAGTWAIGFGGFGAFWYAKKTFRAQREQLELARQDSLRLRTPVLRGELGTRQPGGAQFLLRIRLVSPEPVASLRVVIVNADECPVGFTTGQNGVETWPDRDSLPSGWANDTTRHEGLRSEALMPGESEQWIMAFRKTKYEHGESAGGLSLRAEGTLMSGDSWAAHVVIEATEAARRRLGAISG